MRVAWPTLPFDDDSLPTACRRIADMGFDAVDALAVLESLV